MWYWLLLLDMGQWRKSHHLCVSVHRTLCPQEYNDWLPDHITHNSSTMTMLTYRRVLVLPDQGMNGVLHILQPASQHHVKRERERGGDIQSPPRPITVVIYGQRGEYNYCNYLLLAEIRGCSSLGSARSGWSGGPIVQVMKVMVIYCHIFEFFFRREWRRVSEAERTEWRWRRQLLWLFLSFRFNRVGINAGEP